MNRIAKKLAGYVICKGMVKEEDRGLYEYGFLIAMEMGLGVITSTALHK